MIKSDSIGELAKALATTQGQIEAAKKSSENPFFKSKYADLAAVWDACRAALSKNGIAVIQTPKSSCDENGTVVTVGTLLAHSSGEWVFEELSAAPTKDDPQGIGSCITYLRRYGLSAFVGVAPEDDDGNAASQPSAGKQAQRRPAQATTDQVARKALADQAEKMSQQLGYAPDKIKIALGRLAKLSTEDMGKTVEELSQRLKEKATDTDPTSEESAKKSTLAAIQKEFKEHDWDDGDIGRYMDKTWQGKKLEELSLDGLIAVHDELTGSAVF